MRPEDHCDGSGFLCTCGVPGGECICGSGGNFRGPCPGCPSCSPLHIDLTRECGGKRAGLVLTFDPDSIGRERTRQVYEGVALIVRAILEPANAEAMLAELGRELRAGRRPAA